MTVGLHPHCAQYLLEMVSLSYKEVLPILWKPGAKVIYECINVQAGATGMRSKLAVYRELQDNMSEGLRFYMSLQEAINTLRQQCGDYCLTRSIQK